MRRKSATEFVRGCRASPWCGSRSSASLRKRTSSTRCTTPASPRSRCGRSAHAPASTLVTHVGDAPRLRVHAHDRGQRSTNRGELPTARLTVGTAPFPWTLSHGSTQCGNNPTPVQASRVSPVSRDGGASDTQETPQLSCVLFDAEDENRILEAGGCGGRSIGLSCYRSIDLPTCLGGDQIRDAPSHRRSRLP